MADWQFRCYLVGPDLDVLDEWRIAHADDDALQAKLDTRLRFLRQQPRDRWVRPYFDTLDDDCSGLGEVRFEYKNVQYRPIGFSSGKLEFTFVFVAIEKGGKFVPKNTCKVAQERKTETEKDRNKARDCDSD
ncbi:MAG: type II toxin-antitoxin system RelE/ParE family toxin [Proteobacteria bacterium]|nr:type II toxin-antitoxin system RelE/ParE family toxin [Pseudomonadota bacterium]